MPCLPPYLAGEKAGRENDERVPSRAGVSGLKVTVKEKDFKTRAGSKTAWMGVYYDEKGRECEVTGAKVEMVDGCEVPQVTKYKYLGTPLQIGYKGRHDAMRAKVVSTWISFTVRSAAATASRRGW